MGEQEALEDAFDGGLFVVGEPVECFELEAQVVLGAAFVGFEEQQVGADVESEGDAAQGVEAGLCLAGFVAAEQGDVDVDAVGECLLGESLLLAKLGESVGEGHRGER